MDVDFRVDIGPLGTDGYPVTFRTADGEEASSTMQLPPSHELDALAARVPDAVLASSARARRAATDYEAPVRMLGRILFEALLGSTGTALLMAARSRAARQGGQIRVVLQVRPSELARLPWEFLYDTREDQYVCLEVPLVRHPQVALPMEPLRITPPLRILGMVALPDDQEPLAGRAEQERLRTALADLVAEGLVELDWVAGQDWRALKNKTRPDGRAPGPTIGGRRDWHVFHFIGHGSFDPAAGEGTLALVDDENGGTRYLQASELALMLGRHPSLRVAVLNACESGRADPRNPFSSVAGALMRRGMPAVLAMQYEVSDAAARECTHAFYEALARQLPLDVAVMEARQNMSLARSGSLEWGTPVLYMRSLDHDGRLFDLVGPAAPATPAAATPGPEPLPADRNPHPEPSAGAGVDVEDVFADGLAAFHTERWDEAVEAFRVVVAHDRDHRDARAKLAQAHHSRHVDRAYAAATAAMAERDWDRAVELLEDLAATEADHRDVAGLLMRARDEKVRAGLREEIGVLHGKGRWQAVLAAAERLRGYDTGGAAPPSDPELETMVATARDALETTARKEALARHYREALDHIDAGRWRGALRSLHEVRSLDPAYRDTALLIGKARREARGAGGIVPASPTPTSLTFPNDLCAVAFDADGDRLAVGCTDPVAMIADLSGEVRVTVRHGGFMAWVWDVAFHPDGRRLITGSGDRTARVWDTETGAELLKLQHGGAVLGVAFSPDGHRFATACRDHHARVWDTETGTELLKVTHTNWVRDVAFSPDGRLLATASTDNTARVWDAETGTQLLSLAHGNTVWKAAFSPDGDRLATVCAENTTHLWSTETGAELLKVKHPSRGARYLAFSPDGRHFAAEGSDMTVRVWDAETGAERLQLTHAAQVWGIAFSPDGDRLASCAGKTVQLWQLKKEEDD